ncbi:MAG TPA: hypothetical protein VFU28_09060 [Vicinamibacterales bacterium]|nr:hypothetical protein [Vicinamibacterales bacterium]
MLNIRVDAAIVHKAGYLRTSTNERTLSRNNLGMTVLGESECEGTAMAEEHAAPTSADNDKVRRNVEEDRQVAEELRVSGERLRKRAEHAREAKEAERESQERERILDERQRQLNEELRETAEQLRGGAESIRLDTEAARAAAEDARKIAEVARATQNDLKDLLREVLSQLQHAKSSLS